MQEFIAIGRLTKDVEMNKTPNGTQVARFSLAVARNHANSAGERGTDFFSTVVYGKTAENCGKYLKKGSQVAVVGAIQFRDYETKDGEKRQITELIADRVNFLSSVSGTNKQEEKPASQAADAPELEEIDPENLPF